MKKIIALNCGRKNQFCETFIKAAAQGAEEFGVETEIIRAMSLKVLPCNGCNACFQKGVCVLKDDVEWILEKTLVEDAALIIAVPCYHVRANGYFTSINDRMLHVHMVHPEIAQITRVGGIIGVGGSGYDSWASLNNPMVEIFMQHTRKVVDKIQVNFCALKEWNLWLREDMTPVTQKVRVTDIPYEEMWTAYGTPQMSRIEFFKAALARAKQLGRNVAKAMEGPAADAPYLGEKSGVACPVCQSNILHVHEGLPYVACPICAIRGEIVIDNGKMQVKWNEHDAKAPRFSLEAGNHHSEWIAKHHFTAHEYNQAAEEIMKGYRDYGKIIKPEKA
jgi:multimeric flavodoxin WrbA